MQEQEEKIQNLISSIKSIGDLRDGEMKLREYITQNVDEGHKLIRLIEILCEEQQSGFDDQRVYFLKKRIIVLIAEIFQHQITEYLSLILSYISPCMKNATKEDYQNIIGEIFKDVIENLLKKQEFQNYVEHLDKFLEKLFLLCEDDNKNVQKTAQIILIKIIKKIPQVYQEKKFYYLNKFFLKILYQKNNVYTNYSINAYKVLVQNAHSKCSTQYEIIHELCVDLLKRKEVKIKIATLKLLITLNQIFEKESLKFKKNIQNCLVKLESSQSAKIRELVLELQKRYQQKSKSRQRQPLYNRTSPSPIKKESFHIYDSPKNYDHIGPAIRREQLNKKFLKNSQTEKNQIFFKEKQEQPKNRERFKSFNNNSIKNNLVIQDVKIQAQESFNNFQNVTKSSNKVLNQNTVQNFQDIFKIQEKETQEQDQISEKQDTNQDIEKQISDTNQDIKDYYVSGSEIILKKSLEPLNLYDADSKFFFKVAESRQSHKSNNEKNCCDNCKQYEERIVQLESKTLDQQRDIDEIVSAIQILKQQNDFLQTKVKYFESMVIHLETDVKINQDKRLFQSFGKMLENQSTQNIEKTKNTNIKKQPQNDKNNKGQINDQLSQIFQIKNSQDQVNELLRFLRIQGNNDNLNEIQTNFKHKLLKSLILILNMSSKLSLDDEDIALKWIKLYVNRKEPEDKDELMGLYSGLILLKNTAKSDNLKKQTIEILQNEYMQKAQIYFASDLSKQLPSNDSLPRVNEGKE